MIIQRKMVRFVEFLKKFVPGRRTYWIESIFVLLCLVATAIVSNQGLIEWVGVFAVFSTFLHASVSNRLEEAQDKRIANNEKVEVECYKKQTYYFYIKEVLWLVYFVWLGAWSALVGVIIFLLYPLWRTTWRKYHITLE